MLKIEIKMFCICNFISFTSQRGKSTSKKEISRFFQSKELHQLQYPIALDQMPEIEDQLNLKINIFSFFDDEGKARDPLYISRREHFRKEIDLIYWDEHYAWIKNFQSFIYDISPSHRAKYFVSVVLVCF